MRRRRSSRNTGSRARNRFTTERRGTNNNQLFRFWFEVLDKNDFVLLLVVDEFVGDLLHQADTEATRSQAFLLATLRHGKWTVGVGGGGVIQAFEAKTRAGIRD